MTDDSENLILVVDDEEMNLVILTKILTKAGHSVCTAINGREAIDRVNQAPYPTIILMDLMMPLMSGWDATKIIKESPKTAHIPILAVTALSNEHDRALEFGFDGFCPKPIDFNGLLAMIKKFMVQSA